MTDSPHRFKGSPRRRYDKLGAKLHQEGTTLDIVSFLPAGHKSTATESRGFGRGRSSAAVFTRHHDHQCQHTRRPAR
jgi:hypothetical protein